MTALAITGPACLVADCASLNPVDFVKLKGASWNGVKCEGVILRATRSNGELDADFPARFDMASKLGFLVGAYDFNTGEPVRVQAARFLKATAACGPLLLQALDWEGAPMSLEAALEWLDRVAQGSGRKPWLYSGDRLKTLIKPATVTQRQFLASHLLWGCEYGPAFKLNDDDGVPLPWAKETLWQFTGDGVGPEPHTLEGLQAGADLSIFYGTRADLEEVWAGEPLAAAPVVAAASPAKPAPTGFALWFDHLRNAV